MKRRKALTPREERLNKRKRKALTPREERLKKRRNKLLNKRAAVMGKRVAGGKVSKKIKKRVDYIKNKK